MHQPLPNAFSCGCCVPGPDSPRGPILADNPLSAGNGMIEPLAPGRRARYRTIVPPRPDFALIPFPHTITPRGGSCDLPPRSRWSGDRDAIGLLEGWLSKSSPKADATLVLAVDKDRSDLDEEGYELTIEKSGIRATARTPAGLVYASQTLRQLAFGAARHRPLRSDYRQAAIPLARTHAGQRASLLPRGDRSSPPGPCVPSQAEQVSLASHG